MNADTYLNELVLQSFSSQLQLELDKEKSAGMLSRLMVAAKGSKATTKPAFNDLLHAASKADRTARVATKAPKNYSVVGDSTIAHGRKFKNVESNPGRVYLNDPAKDAETLKSLMGKKPTEMSTKEFSSFTAAQQRKMQQQGTWVPMGKKIQRKVKAHMGKKPVTPSHTAATRKVV
jgi:hypothetical protein